MHMEHCMFACKLLPCCLHFEHSKDPAEQFLLFGEISPDKLRVPLYQDEETTARRVSRRNNETPTPMEMDPIFDMDVLMSEFSDTLFSTLASHQPISWPNLKDVGEERHSLLFSLDFILRRAFTRVFVSKPLRSD